METPMQLSYCAIQVLFLLFVLHTTLGLPVLRSKNIERNRRIRQNKAQNQDQIVSDEVQCIGAHLYEDAHTQTPSDISDSIVNDSSMSCWPTTSRRSSRIRRQNFADLSLFESMSEDEEDEASASDYEPEENPADALDLNDSSTEVPIDATSSNVPSIDSKEEVEELTESEKRAMLRKAWKQNHFDDLTPKELAAAVKHLSISGMTGKNISEKIKGMINKIHGADFSLRYSTYLKEWNATLSNLYKSLEANGRLNSVGREERLAMAKELMEKKERRKANAAANPHRLNKKRVARRLEKETLVMTSFLAYLEDKDLDIDDLSIEEMERLSRGMEIEGINSIVYTKRLLSYLESNPEYGPDAAEKFRASRMAYLRSIASRRKNKKAAESVVVEDDHCTLDLGGEVEQP